MIKVLASNIKQYKMVTFMTPFFTAMEVFLEILIPFVTSKIIDEGIQKNNMDAVVKFGAIMLVFALMSLFSGIMAGRCSARAATGFAANLRESLFKNIQTFSFSNIDRFSTAGLVTRMTTDITNIQNAFHMVIRIAVRAPLMLISSIIMSMVISVRLSMVFLVALIVLGGTLFLIMRNTMPLFTATFEKYDELNRSVQENVSAIRVVKSFVREGHEREKFEGASGILYKMFLKAECILAANNPVMMICIYGCILSISWFGAHFIVEGTLTTGNLTSLFSYVMSMLMSLIILSMIFVMITMSLASARRISEALLEQADIVSPEDPIMQVKDGSIDFEHVNFVYTEGEGDAILSDIDLHIKSGQTVGIIGGTGSGKSTLVNLISRLYDVKSGSVLVGGTDVRKYDIQSLRAAVSVVLQKNILFSGSILDNLRWGNENASDEECIYACKLACADEFIEKLPDKYESKIEQGGSNVSGGQRQRLCIARALVKQPKVLILDDSTSAVDTATDSRIRKAFAENIPDTTKLIISQRISGIKDADMIVVLDDGKISGIGTHEELIVSNKVYKEIYEAQEEAKVDFDKGEAV